MQYKYSNTSSVTLRATPSAPVSATPTAFASQIGQFPTGEGWQKFLLPSAQVSDPRPRHPLSSGRADNACTNLLGFFVRYVRTRGIMRLRRERYCRLLLCHVPHALATHYFLRLTRARGGCFLRGWKALLNDFWYFWSYKSTIREKVSFMLLFKITPKTPTSKYGAASRSVF